MSVPITWVSTPRSYLELFPVSLVTEIHLAGHTADPALGDALLIDSHDAPVDPAVWQLYGRLIARIGLRPTLIERDGNLPAFDELLAERTHAHDALVASVPALLAREVAPHGSHDPAQVPGPVRAGAACDRFASSTGSRYCRSDRRARLRRLSQHCDERLH